MSSADTAPNTDFADASQSFKAYIVRNQITDISPEAMEQIGLWLDQRGVRNNIATVPGVQQIQAIRGSLPASGTTPTAGTGFTYTHTNGTGVYVITFSAALATVPVVVCTMTANNPSLSPVLSSITVNGFTVTWRQDAGTAADSAFNFIAQPVST